MPRALKAERYAEKASATLIRIIERKLHYWTFAEAMRFYLEAVPRLKGPDLALLGCNDRFFLLCWLCNRADALHPWLYDRAREVEANPDGYIDLWSREHYKSTICSFVGVIQEILCDPEITIGIFSNTKDIARPFLAQIKRELESNQSLISLYPDVLWRDGKERKGSPMGPSWSVDGGITVKRKGNPKEATVEAHGLIDAMPTGRHFQILLFDDVVTEKNVSNQEMIAKTAERFELADNLGKAEGSRRQIAGTRYSYADYYGEMIANGIAIPRIYPATHDGTLDGKPVFWSQAVWDRKKKTQRTTAAAQLLQNPLAGKEQTFRVEWLRPYHVRPAMMNVYILGDPSHGRNKTSDRTAIPVIGIDTLANKYLLDGYCHRMQLTERWTRLRDLQQKWSNMPGVRSVEVGWERYGMQSDLDYFEERMRLERVSFTIKELNWTGEQGGESKKYRVGRLEPDFRDSSFFVPWKVWHPRVSPKLDGEGRPLMLSDGTPDLEAGIARWYLREEDDDIHLVHAGGMHAQERRCKEAGEHWRIMEALRRRDEDKNIYDLTRVFFEEYRRFPLASHDDLVDAMSRIYDMEPVPPVPFEEVEVQDYVDA